MRRAAWTVGVFALLLPSLVAAQEGLTAAQQQQIDQLRASIVQLQQQLQVMNGRTIAVPPLVPGSGAPAADLGEPGSYASYQAALRQLLGVPPAVPSAAPLPASAGNASAPPPAAVRPTAGGRSAATRPDLGGPAAKIPVGYVAAGMLTMTVNSDYPGPWRGTLSQPIYSIDGSEVLFPEGSVVVGRVIRISGPNDAINNRLGLLPTYLVRPDGESFPINQQAILDQLGISGIADQVDYHLGVQLAAIGAFTGVNSLPDIIAAQGGAFGTIQGNFFQLTTERGQILLNRYLTLLPTITVRAGTDFRIFFSEEMFAQIVRPRDRFELTNMARPSGAVP